VNNVIASIYCSTINMTTPLLLTSLGGAITYHAGIINVSMEGLMLAGAFAAVVFSYLFSSALIGVVAAVTVSVLFSLLYSFFVSTLKTDNFAIGFALNIFISSLTLYLSRIMFVGQNVFNSPDINAIPNLNVNLYFPLFNELFSGFSVLTYIALGLLFIVSYIIYKTPFGLWLRAAGSQPDALTVSGKKVQNIQYLASVMTGVLCGLAGSQLSLSNVVMFSRDMSSGRGFIALAIILISGGRPIVILALSMLFGLLETLSLQLQLVAIPAQFLFMLPYLMTIITFVIANIPGIRRWNKKA